MKGSSMKEQRMVKGLVMMLVVGFLMSRPNCNRGCRTMLQHIFECGLSDFLGGLPV
jgi:hypothetical protein